MHISQLESRRLFAATVDAYGTITVTGTHKDDLIVISTYNNDVLIKMAHKTTTFPITSSTALVVEGMAGDDTVQIDSKFFENIATTISGGSGDDNVSGGPERDLLQGDTGNDTLNGGDGDDILDGGLGSDVIAGGAGHDTDQSYQFRNEPVYASNSGLPDSGQTGEHDTIEPDVEGIGGGSAGNDTIIGMGDDQLDLGGGAGGHNLVISESTAGALMVAGGSNNTIQGGPGDDTVLGTDGGSDFLSGGAGINKISFARDFDPVYIDLRGTTHGGSVGQNDTLASDFDDAQGGQSSDTIIGNADDNILVGGELGSTIHGMGGNDTIYGQNGDDHLFADGGVAHIYGYGGNDHIYGSVDSKVFAYGGPGQDTVNADVLGKSVSVESILNS